MLLQANISQAWKCTWYGTRRCTKNVNLFWRSLSARNWAKSLQVPSTAEIALEAIEKGMCVVIGLQSTGEANTMVAKEQSGDNMEDFVSAPQQILLGWLNNHFPRDACGLSENQLHGLYYQVSLPDIGHHTNSIHHSRWCLSNNWLFL